MEVLGDVKKALIDKIFEILSQNTCPIRFMDGSNAIDDIKRTTTWDELRSVAGINCVTLDKGVVEAIRNYPVEET